MLIPTTPIMIMIQSNVGRLLSIDPLQSTSSKSALTGTTYFRTDERNYKDPACNGVAFCGCLAQVLAAAA